MNSRAAKPIHGLTIRNGEEFPASQFVNSGKFGRIFAILPSFTPSVDSLTQLGNAMIEAEQEDQNPQGDNVGVPAGYTYLGQFIDHDITFDTSGLQESLVDPLSVENFRTPALDLDCLYGSGPAAQPYLYEREDPDKFLIGQTNTEPGRGDPNVPTQLPNDLPRASNGFGLLGDPRNDENLVVAQTHLAFLKFHNKIVTQLKDGSLPRQFPLSKTVFEEARTLVIWHYQWIVLNDFLRRILDNEQIDDVLKNGRSFYYFGKRPFIPVEFAVAAYRLGHSMVRAVYDYNRVFRVGGVTPATLGLLFRFSGRSGDSVPIPSDWIIDWRRFFELDDNIKPNPSRNLDPFLADPLKDLPEVPVPNTLSVRNLLRGRSVGLPSAQSVAKFIGFQPLTPDEIAQGSDGEVAKSLNFHIETPLWYYILKEGQVQQQGKRLGQVGSRIVAEVFIGLLEGDSTSFLSQDKLWKPTLPNRFGQVGCSFEMADLISFVGDINPIGDESPAPTPSETPATAL